MAEEEDNDETPVPDTGAVFTFGRSRFADNVPNRFWIRNDPVKQVACGDEHTLLLTKSGRIFSFGANDWGQLGHGNLKVYTKPTSIKALKGAPAYLVACGRSHSIVALEERRVVAFGQNSDGELGVGDTEQHNAPVTIDALKDVLIVEASGGAHHSAALTDAGQLYFWGSNAEGQLGIPHVGEEVPKPTRLEFPERICHVSCGYYHTAIATAEGHLFTFGEGECGKLGHPVRRNEMVKEPRMVDISGAVAAVTCGGKHTIALTQSGQLYVFGDGADGQLGLGNDVTELEGPRLLEQLASQNVIHISCGESHSAAITDQNQVYVWGSDRYGKLGIVEDLNDQQNKYFEPQRLQRFAKFDAVQVSCGGCHTIILARPDSEQEQRDQATASTPQKQSITGNQESIAEDLTRQWKEQEKENIDRMDESEEKLPKLLDSQKSEILQGAMTARARRRQSSMCNNVAARDHPPSLADRAVSISTEVHRSLNGTSHSKSAFADICQDADLIKKFEKTQNTGEDSDEETSTAFRHNAEDNDNEHSHIEMLHKEINRSLTVFCRDTADDQKGPSKHKTSMELPESEEDCATDAKASSVNHQGAVYARQAAPIPAAPPTRITAVAQKYARETGVSDPSSSMSDKNRYIVDEQSGRKATENSKGSSYDLKEIEQSQHRFDDEDAGLSMIMDKQRRDDHDVEMAEETAGQGSTGLGSADDSKPDVRPAFTDSTGQGDASKNQSPLKRISGLIARMKDTKSKANGEANGKESGSGLSGMAGKKSRACVIL